MPVVSRIVSVVAVSTLVVTALSGCATLVDGEPGPASGRRAPAVTAGPTGPRSAGHPYRAQHPAQHPASPTARPPTARPAAHHPQPGTALGALGTLTVRGRAPMTGYSREAFGPAWLDANRNGCDERNDVLARDLRERTEQNCRILTGTLADPYTGRTISYVYGVGTLIDIDHVVALGNAWASGAWRWDPRERAALATDPLNLLAVDASANRQKGDGDAATWLPSAASYRCAYVARQVAVKAKFALSVTPAEQAAVARVLASCPQQPLPADSGAPLEVDHRLPVPAPAPASTPASAPAGTGTRGGAVWYENCDAARAAGAAPVRRGDPGYDAHLDGDGDGSACE